jgi:hypothetical protein
MSTGIQDMNLSKNHRRDTTCEIIYIQVKLLFWIPEAKKSGDSEDLLQGVRIDDLVTV